jgi:RimJ/RimL family protein N-acetyltransferase
VADAPALLEVRTDAAIAMWSPEGGGSDPASAQEALVTFMDWSSGRQASFALEDATGALAGSVRLYRIDWDERHAEVGYWAAARARGRGLTSLAVDTVARWALDDLGLRRLDLHHAVSNPASCRVAQKAGFVLDKVLRRSYRYGDGRLYDEHQHVRRAVAE